MIEVVNWDAKARIIQTCVERENYYKATDAFDSSRWEREVRQTADGLMTSDTERTEGNKQDPRQNNDLKPRTCLSKRQQPSELLGSNKVLEEQKLISDELLNLQGYARCWNMLGIVLIHGSIGSVWTVKLLWSMLMQISKLIFGKKSICWRAHNKYITTIHCSTVMTLLANALAEHTHGERHRSQ